MYWTNIYTYYVWCGQSIVYSPEARPYLSSVPGTLLPGDVTIVWGTTRLFFTRLVPLRRTFVSRDILPALMEQARLISRDTRRFPDYICICIQCQATISRSWTALISTHDIGDGIRRSPCEGEPEACQLVADIHGLTLTLPRLKRRHSAFSPSFVLRRLCKLIQIIIPQVFHYSEQYWIIYQSHTFTPVVVLRRNVKR